MWCMHEIIADGSSSAIIQQEANELLTAYRMGINNPLKPLKIQYKDYSEWQHQEINKERIQEQERYWFINTGLFVSNHSRTERVK